MPIDPLTEPTISFAEAAEKLGVSPSTIGNWAEDGIRGVKLDHVRVGRGLRTTEEALRRFIDQTNGRGEEPPPEPHRSKAKRRRDHERADRQLQAKGF